MGSSKGFPRLILLGGFMLTLILLVFALVLFCIAAFVNPVEPWRGKLCCIAFACWVASELVKGIPQLGR